MLGQLEPDSDYRIFLRYYDVVHQRWFSTPHLTVRTASANSHEVSVCVLELVPSFPVGFVSLVHSILSLMVPYHPVQSHDGAIYHKYYHVRLHRPPTLKLYSLATVTSRVRGTSIDVVCLHRRKNQEATSEAPMVWEVLVVIWGAWKRSCASIIQPYLRHGCAGLSHRTKP
jgi:hypothetical protein